MNNKIIIGASVFAAAAIVYAVLQSQKNAKTNTNTSQKTGSGVTTSKGIDWSSNTVDDGQDTNYEITIGKVLV